MAGRMDGVKSRVLNVDGIRTHYLEAGDGPTVVLLHSAEFGAAAEISWEFNIGPLAKHFRVLAPDWLGFGHTDKIFDFGSGGGFPRRIEHMRRFLEVMSVDAADFVGNSMGATLLLRLSAMDHPPLPLRRQVVISGGGPIPATPARHAVLDYDCTPAGMRRLLGALLSDERWAADDAYVQKRVAMSLVPGAWQCSATDRFQSPAVDGALAEAGPPATIRYEDIRVPTLVIAGRKDLVRPLEYMEDVHRRIPNAQLLICDAGHASNIEQADDVNRAIVDFLSQPPVGT